MQVEWIQLQVYERASLELKQFLFHIFSIHSNQELYSFPSFSQTTHGNVLIVTVIKLHEIIIIVFVSLPQVAMFKTLIATLNPMHILLFRKVW